MTPTICTDKQQTHISMSCMSKRRSDNQNNENVRRLLSRKSMIGATKVRKMTPSRLRMHHRMNKQQILNNKLIVETEINENKTIMNKIDNDFNLANRDVKEFIQHLQKLREQRYCKKEYKMNQQHLTIPRPLLSYLNKTVFNPTITTPHNNVDKTSITSINLYNNVNLTESNEKLGNILNNTIESNNYHQNTVNMSNVSTFVALNCIEQSSTCHQVNLMDLGNMLQQMSETNNLLNMKNLFDNKTLVKDKLQIPIKNTINNNNNNNNENMKTLKNYANICEIKNSTSLLDVAIKTIKLMRQNQILQKQLSQLQMETTNFIESVLSNPENQHFRKQIHN